MVTTVEALAMSMAAKEATTRTVATKRSMVWCTAATEAAVPVQVTLMATSKVPTTNNGQTRSPARKTETVMLPGHEPSEGKNKV